MSQSLWGHVFHDQGREARHLFGVTNGPRITKRFFHVGITLQPRSALKGGTLS